MAIHRIIQNYRQLDPLLDPTDRDALNPRLRVLHFAPDYFSAERFLHWLQRSFREYQDSNIAVSRILFSSINQLLHNSPMFPLEKLFIDALLELFKRKEVTSLFLGSESAQNAEIANAFDVILFTGFQRQSGLEQVTVRVGHSGPCNADGDTFIIRRERRGERVWLSLEKPRSKSSR